jgi:hypothetical protein
LHQDYDGVVNAAREILRQGEGIVRLPPDVTHEQLTPWRQAADIIADAARRLAGEGSSACHQEPGPALEDEEDADDSDGSDESAGAGVDEVDDVSDDDISVSWLHQAEPRARTGVAGGVEPTWCDLDTLIDQMPSFYALDYDKKWAPLHLSPVFSKSKRDADGNLKTEYMMSSQSGYRYVYFMKKIHEDASINRWWWKPPGQDENGKDEKARIENYRTAEEAAVDCAMYLRVRDEEHNADAAAMRTHDFNFQAQIDAAAKQRLDELALKKKALRAARIKNSGRVKKARRMPGYRAIHEERVAVEQEIDAMRSGLM